jgi:hypothetical protein
MALLKVEATGPRRGTRVAYSVPDATRVPPPRRERTMTRQQADRRRLILTVVGLVTAGCNAEIGEPGANGDRPPASTQDQPGLDTPGDGGGNPAGTEPGEGSGGDPTNSGCVSDRVEVPAGEQCVCAFDSCDATAVSCSCDLSCYAGEDCLIVVNDDGNVTTSDGLLGSCDLTCAPEDDLSDEMTCSASNCEIEPNVVEINPASSPTPPAVSSFEAERQVTEVDVTFVVDNSGSMVDNQMAAACAIDSFYATASENGAAYQTGVLTTDMLGDRQAPGGTYDKYSGEFLAPPGLMSLAAPCDTAVQCNAECNATIDEAALCSFAAEGEPLDSDAPGAQETLRQLIVQGDDGSNYEGGLEQAFQLFAEQERQGTFDYAAPHEVVVISDEDADADLDGTTQWLCPFYRPERNTDALPGFDPPVPGNTMESCHQDLIDFYTYYFTTRQIVVHGLLFTSDCNDGSTESNGSIYLAVIQASGGVADSICHCERFDDFFSEVGQSTSTLSTEMCFSGSLPDPSTMTVVYAETGEVVPQSSVDGWTLDAELNCIVMHGAWLSRYGSYRVEYVDPDAPPPAPQPPQACLPAGVDPLLDTIHVFCNGQEVPPSAANGFTFDPVSDCFTFHGAFEGVDGTTCTLEYL